MTIAKFDFHCHVYPLPDWPQRLQPLKSWLLGKLNTLTLQGQIQAQKIPLLKGKYQSFGAETYGAYLLAHLSIESTYYDFIASVQKNGVMGALVVAHPPLIPNLWISEVANNTKNLIPAWQFPVNRSVDYQNFAKHMKQKNVRVLKIHPLADNIDPHSDVYQNLLQMAEENNWLVVVHSGEVLTKSVFPNPHYGRVEGLVPWFHNFPKLRFVVAHLNMADPDKAIEIGKSFDNVQWTTSWQSAETIAKAIAQLGVEKVLFASDWPMLGANHQFQIGNAEKAFFDLGLPLKEQEKFYFLNAKELLNHYGITLHEK